SARDRFLASRIAALRSVATTVNASDRSKWVEPCRSPNGPMNGRLGRVSPIAMRPSEGRLTDPIAAAQPRRHEPVFMLRVFGRLPVSGVTRCSEAGVRKASGEETAGEFAPAVVSVYGDLACVCPDLWISNGDHGRVIIVALALVAACRIGTVVL